VTSRCTCSPSVAYGEHARGCPDTPRTADAERKVFKVRLPRGTHERLLAAADDHNVSANLIATRALEEFLGRMVPVEEFKWTR
jgi:predicted HicB family RNase H-like nuclease